MFKNYFKTTIRSLWKQKLFSLINIFGLALGLCVTIFILLYVQAEESYDAFHENNDKIYRVLRQSSINDNPYLIGVTAGPFGPALASDYPESVKDFVRIMPNNGLVTYNNRSFQEDKIFFADANFFDFFTYPLEMGNPDKALSEPNTIVLTREMAEKYFGEQNPLGEILRLDNRYDFTVTGVISKIDGRSHLDFDFMASIKIFEQTSWFGNWWSNGCMTYLLIDNAAEAGKLSAQLPAFMDKYFAEDFERTGNKVGLLLQPMSDIYFQKDVRYDFALHGDKGSVYVFFAIALFILGIACINYMNLTTAKANRRAREIGVRKVLGAFRSRLIVQFLSESFLMTFIAILIAVAAVELLLPFFNNAFDLNLMIDFTELPVLFLLGILLLIVSLLAGSYPAFMLSAFKPVSVLKNRVEKNFRGLFIRKGLVVFQFCISAFLIIATLIIGQQLNYMNTKSLGFDTEQILVVRLNTLELYQQKDDLADRFRTLPAVKSVSFASGEPGGFHDGMSFEVEGLDQKVRLRTVQTDFDYAKTYGLTFVAGRDFSRSFGTDADKAVLLNETAAKALGYSPEEALGKTVRNTLMDSTLREVVGVVKDYHFSSLKDEIEPLIIFMGSSNWTMGIKVQTADIQGTIHAITEKWEAYAPAYPFEYVFLDDSFQLLYQQEQTESRLFSIFSFISIVIACLGIFALAAFAAEERTKEIGIRKVLGASVQNIVSLLSGDFIKLILIGNLLAWPIVWFAMENWLQKFAYRINIDGWTFLLASALTLLIALITISYQAIKSALINPVESLKYE